MKLFGRKVLCVCDLADDNTASIFKQFDKKGLNKKSINKIVGESNIQWYLTKKTKDPLIDHLVDFGQEFKVPAKEPSPKKDADEDKSFF